MIHAAIVRNGHQVRDRLCDFRSQARRDLVIVSGDDSSLFELRKESQMASSPPGDQSLEMTSEWGLFYKRTRNLVSLAVPVSFLLLGSYIAAFFVFLSFRQALAHYDSIAFVVYWPLLELCHYISAAQSTVESVAVLMGVGSEWKELFFWYQLDQYVLRECL